MCKSEAGNGFEDERGYWLSPEGTSLIQPKGEAEARNERGATLGDEANGKQKPKGLALIFQWQAGYGAFSVSASNVEHVKRYIANQEEHHKRMSFQDEFRELCTRHGIEIDERYVWD